MAEIKDEQQMTNSESEGLGVGGLYSLYDKGLAETRKLEEDKEEKRRDTITTSIASQNKNLENWNNYATPISQVSPPIENLLSTTFNKQKAFNTHMNENYSDTERQALIKDQDTFTRKDIDALKKMAQDEVAVIKASELNKAASEAMSSVRGNKTYVELSKSSDPLDQAKFQQLQQLNATIAPTQKLVQAALGEKLHEQIRGVQAEIDAARESGQELNVKQKIALMESTKPRENVKNASAQAEAASSVKQYIQKSIEKAQPKQQEVSVERQAEMTKDKVLEQIKELDIGSAQAARKSAIELLEERRREKEGQTLKAGLESERSAADIAVSLKKSMVGKVEESSKDEHAQSQSTPRKEVASQASKGFGR